VFSDGPTITPELQALLDSSPDAVLIVDRAGCIVALNHRAEAVFGWSGAELRGRLVEALLPKAQRAGHVAARAAYTAAPTVRRMSARSRLTGLRADGTEFPLEIALTPIVGSAAGLVMAVVHDVAERVRLEGALDSTDRMLDAMDAIPEAVLTTDAKGHVDLLNRSAEALTGMTRASARGRPLGEVLPVTSEDSGEPLACLAPTGLGDAAVADSFEGVLAGGEGRESRVLDLSATPIRNASGTVTGATIVARDVTHARLIARQLSHQATHDPLTGLVNRAEFEQRLLRAVASAADGRAEHAVCFVDLDGFKRVNDACGHMAGDEMLRQLSEVMHERMRSRDTLGRLGGDEFGLLLEHCRLPRAERIADGIRQAVGAHRFTFGAATYGVAASIGIAPVRAGTWSATEVLREADAACYLAKRAGGNRVQVSTPRPEGAGPADEWSRRVVQAVRRREFQLYAQPLVPLDGGGPRPPCCEILLRLAADTGEPLGADAFLPTARRHGLMPAVDQWVVRETVRRLSARQAAHPGDECLTVAINLDDETVVGGRLLPTVRRALADSGVPADALCFEIGEAVAAAHPVVSEKLLEDLRTAGCQTTLEHCGTGMGAFTFLPRLRPDYLKIAGHIVHGLAGDPVRRALATALNEVGHALGLRTIAVGVEEPADLACLRDMGVDFAQGYGCGRPAPLGW
jgi:diguanylate cyclase (GGDEF)-like protein/PAS domain S-box-containing protein